MEPFFLILLKVLLLVSISHLTGSVLISLFGYNLHKPFFRFFIQQLTGVTAIVFFIAVVFTGGKTIMLGFIPIAFGFWIIKHKKFYSFQGIPKCKIIPKGHIIIVSLLGLFSILVIEYLLFFPGKDLVTLPHMDYVYYGKVSNYLTAFGIETNLLEYIYPETTSLRPYHYMELWLNGGLSFLFGVNHIFNYFLVTVPYGLFLTWLGLIALGESIIKLNVIVYFLAFFSLFFIGFRFPFLETNDLFLEVPNFIHNPWNFPKLLPIFWFLIPALITLLNKQTRYSFLFLASLVIVYVTTIPGVAGTMLLWFFIGFFRFKFRFVKENLPAIISVLFYPAFYFFFSDFLSIDSEVSNLYRFADLAYWKTFFNIFGKTIFQVGYLFWPVFFLFLINILFNNKLPLKLSKQPLFWGAIFSILFFSLFSWAGFHRTVDSMQFFANINGVVMVILFFSLTMNILFNLPKAHYFVLTFFVLVSIHGGFAMYKGKKSFSSTKVSISRLEIIKEKLSNRNPIGVFLIEKERLRSVFYKKPTLNTLGRELSLISSQFHLISLSVFETPIEEGSLYASEEKNILESSTFSKFVKSKKALGSFSSIEQSQLDFINEKDINYLVCSKNYPLSENLRKLISETIQLETENEVLHILQND